MISGIRSRLTPLLRPLKAILRSIHYRMLQRMDPVVVTQAQIESALRQAGLRPGDTVFFQSAMSAFGRIEGGAAAVIAALQAVVGGDGTIAMPAFPLVGTALEYLEGKPVFDARHTPSRMGAVTELFRRRPGVVRSLHPTHSITALGPGADRLVALHQLADTPFGRQTPFAGLVECDALQIWFGCGLRAFTLYHTFECLHPAFPLAVFLDREIEARCIDAQGATLTVRTRVHDPAIARRRIDHQPAVERSLRCLLLQRGLLQSIRLGKGEILAIRLKVLMAELEALLREGITIYDSGAVP